MPEDQRQLHDEIVATCLRVATGRTHFRAPDVPTCLSHEPSPRRHVDRDLVICALLNKAANTHKAVRLLCDGGMANDAMNLARVLFETSVNLRWILNSDDWLARLDLYCLYAAAIDKQTSEAFRKHIPGHNGKEGIGNQTPDLLAVADDLFLKSSKRWPRVRDGESWKPLTFQQMLEEFEEQEGSFSYEYVFARLSGFVHSTVLSITHQMDDHPDREYSIRYVPHCELAGEALALSNAFMVLALQAVDDRVGLGISEGLSKFIIRLSAAPTNDAAGEVLSGKA